MSRKPRIQSESGFYHIYARGSGRQLIFEDNRDRYRFVFILQDSIKNSGAKLFAYCLMGNHYHMIVRSDFLELSALVRKINQNYAFYFNKRHERSGHLFQARFCSEPIDDDSYFLEAIRYVHRNPVEARMTSTCDYPWSSYREYLNGTDFIDTEMVLEMLGGPDAFASFHQHSGKSNFSEDFPRQTKKPECEIVSIARSTLNGTDPGNLKSFDKPHRDKCLKALKASGLSLAEIALITGISRSTISRIA